MNEAGSWWTVHPDCEAACADEVFRPGLAHRCPPNGGGSASRCVNLLLECLLSQI